MNPTAIDQDRTLVKWVAVIAIFAVFIRLIYQSGMLAFDGSFNNGSDSREYIRAAHILWTTGAEPQVGRVSLYNYFILGVFKLVGSESLRAVVTIQAILDSLTVAGIALAARAFARELVIPAALTVAILPNFLVQSSYVLSENIFLLMTAWALAALLWAIKSKHVFILLFTSGVLFGLTLLTRLTMTYLPLFLVPGLIFALRTENRFSWPTSIVYSFIIPITMIITASPLLIYNYTQFGYIALSSQPGSHMLFWVYGCLATSWPCADRGGVSQMMAPIAREYINTNYGADANAFAASAAMKKLALERILELPKSQVLLGMAWGAFLNMMQTGFYAVFYQFHQAPTFLSAMKGETFLDRAQEFIAVNWKSPFMFMWVVSQATLLASRFVQLLGVFTGLSNVRFRAQTVLLICLVGYILVLNGPIADPKYRIPIEPALIILFALSITYNPLMLLLRRKMRFNKNP